MCLKWMAVIGFFNPHFNLNISTPPRKVLWIKQNEPDNYKKICTILLPHDYINFYLTGVKRMEYGDASGTGLLNVRTRDWCKDLIDFVDPSLIDKIPEIQSSMNIHGEVRPEILKEFGITISKNPSVMGETVKNVLDKK